MTSPSEADCAVAGFVRASNAPPRFVSHLGLASPMPLAEIPTIGARSRIIFRIIAVLGSSMCVFMLLNRVRADCPGYDRGRAAHKEALSEHPMQVVPIDLPFITDFRQVPVSSRLRTRFFLSLNNGTRFESPTLVVLRPGLYPEPNEYGRFALKGITLTNAVESHSVQPRFPLGAPSATTLRSPQECGGHCLNPHPGQFRSWYGQANGCWVQVWRQWPEGCTHYQMFNTCNNYFDPQIYWTCCVH
jgi:hypothetical protein